jgi:hypothetical protein
MQVKYGTFKAGGVVLTVCNVAVLISFLYLVRISKPMAVAAIAIWLLIMAITVYWAIAYSLRRITFVCSNCGTKGRIIRHRGFVCPRCRGPH